MILGDPGPAGASFLDGGGELGALMRAHDWSRTPLGPAAAWPQSLKTAVRIMLTSRQPFWLGWGPELTYLYNDPYKSIIGGKHPWALGRPFAEVWSEIWDVVGPMADSVMRRDEGTYVEAQLLIMQRHGYEEETYYTFSYSPIPDDAGGRGGLICANTDDTRRVVGERQLATQRQLAAATAPARTWKDACVLGVSALLSNGRDVPFALCFVQDQADAPTLACASPATEAMQDPSTWPLADVVRTSATRVVTLDSTLRDLPTGSWQRPPTTAAVVPIPDSARTGRRGALILGLNPFRRFDETYRNFVEFLARQLADGMNNAEAYEQQRRRAEGLAELDRAKTTFFSNVSHELRTPLTLMLGPLEDLLARPGETLAPDDRELLGVVRRNGQRLLKLVNTLLEFSRIEAGRVSARYQATDLAALTSDIAVNFKEACERAGIRLVVECEKLPEPVYVDRDMWERIVLNLLSNAFKFTLLGEIRVRLRATEGHVELLVSDTGVGIPQSELPRLFERFHRIEGTRGRSHEGSGIGLALVQELAKLHGGSVRAESREGAGSTFTVTVPLGHGHLPAERLVGKGDGTSSPSRVGAYVDEALSWLGGDEHADATLDVEVPASAGPRPRILLAEDNADMRDYVRRLLSSRYDIEAVPDGQAALESIRTRLPDLVVSDVMMPRVDGFALLQALRVDPRTRSIPFLMLSARAGEEARIEGLRAGADDYLVKPFSARELIARADGMIALARARRETQTILAGISDGFVSLDREWRFTYVNAAAAAILGADRERLLGEALWDAFPGGTAAPLAQELARASRERVPVQVEYRDAARDRWYESRAYPTDEGLSVYFVDITARKEAEQALKDADRRKDEFLATLAHELRNPLAPVRIAAEILQRAPGETESISASEMINRQVANMTRLIDDLMDVSRISRGKIELRTEHVDLGAVVESAVETVRSMIQAAGQEISLSLPREPLWLDADPTRLAQVFANLLNNASKYSKRGGKIRLEAKMDDGTAVVRVRDEGIGIAPPMLERIFEMFVQDGSALDRAHGGLGIGLTLVRSLVEMHGGTVEARSEGAGHGAEFVVRLPLLAEEVVRPTREPETMASAQSASAANGVRVLIADDNVDAAQSLGMYLEMLGCEVRTANDGEAAFALAAHFRPELALLDLGMPRLSGHDLAKRIRNESWGRSMTLIAVTGWGQHRDRMQSAEAGFDQHVVKPIAPDVVHELVARAAERIPPP